MSFVVPMYESERGWVQKLMATPGLSQLLKKRMIFRDATTPRITTKMLFLIGILWLWLLGLTAVKCVITRQRWTTDGL